MRKLDLRKMKQFSLVAQLIGNRTWILTTSNTKAQVGVGLGWGCKELGSISRLSYGRTSCTFMAWVAPSTYLASAHLPGEEISWGRPLNFVGTFWFFNYLP